MLLLTAFASDQHPHTWCITDVTQKYSKQLQLHVPLLWKSSKLMCKLPVLIASLQLLVMSLFWFVVLGFCVGPSLIVVVTNTIRRVTYNMHYKALLLCTLFTYTLRRH